MSADPSGQDAARLEILLVEDDDEDAFLVEDELSMSGARLRVTRARTLGEAQAAVSHATSCILLDLQLPDAFGLHGVEVLRDMTAAPIVVLTGFDDLQRGIAALSAGAQDYLAKGLTERPMLLRAIRYAIERRRSEAAAVALREAELHARESARMERGLLPRPIVHDGRATVHSAYRPGRRSAVLGGDFFDVVETDDGALHVMIGDVSGHAADEAALGATLRIAWRTLVLDGGTDQVLRTLDRVLVNERPDPDMFATVATVTITPDRRRAHVSLAGHPAPLLVSGRVRQIDAPPGLPLGVELDARWSSTELELGPSWALMLFTDGLYEGRAQPGGEARLGAAGLMDEMGRRTASASGRAVDAALLDALIADVEARNGGPLSDDVATLVVSYA